MTTSHFSLIVAEDHELTRIGLVAALQRKGNLEVLAEAENGRDAVRQTRMHGPDVVLMDIGMPEMDGIQATHAIKQEFPEVKVVILSSRQEPEEIFASMSSGADAYCLKDIRVERLLQVLQMVRDGGIWLDPPVAEILMNALPRESANAAKNEFQDIKLTDRELEVLRLLCEGQSNKEIATALQISLHTVKAHVCNIIHKMAVDDRTQVAIKAIQSGLVN